MAAETGFLIDGTIYEIPTLRSFDMDEAQVLYDLSGLGIEDFVKPEDVPDDEFSELMDLHFKNPSFVRALMHIAYQRANPRQNPSRVKAVIGGTNMVEVLNALKNVSEKEDVAEKGADDGPPASTTELEPSSPTSSVVSNENSGGDSTRTSDEQDDQPASTTAPELATSSISAPEISAE